MKKRVIATGLALTLVLGACSKEEEKPKTDNNVEVKHEETKKVEKKQGLTDRQLAFLALTKEASVTDKGVLNATFALTNNNDKDIKLDYAKENPAQIKVYDASGAVIDTKALSVDDVKELKVGEKKKWGYSFNLGKKYGRYRVEISLNIETGEGQEIGRQSSVEVEYKNKSENQYAFTPKQEKTLVYENYDGSGQDITEQYLFFENGYSQTYNSKIGGNTVYYSDNTGYYRVYTGEGTKKGNIISDITPKKEMLVKLPATKGDTWKENTVTNKVVETNATVKTKFGKLTNVVVVVADMGQEVTFYYHPNYGLVKVEAGKQPVMELKAVK